MSEAAIPVVLSVTDEYMDRLSEVLAAASMAGFVAEHVLSDLGTVVGSIDPVAMDTVAALPGVASIERQRSPGTGPPDSGVQ